MLDMGKKHSSLDNILENYSVHLTTDEYILLTRRNSMNNSCSFIK